MKTLFKTNGSLLSSTPSLMEDYLFRNLANWTNDSWRAEGSTLPAVNIDENNEGFVIELAAPGMKRDDFKIEVVKNTITVAAENKKRDNESKDVKSYTRREFSYHTFQRSFSLPDNADAEKISARYEDGILLLTVPKKDVTRLNPVRTISVK